MFCEKSATINKVVALKAGLGISAFSKLDLLEMKSPRQLLALEADRAALGDAESPRQELVLMSVSIFPVSTFLGAHLAQGSMF